MDEYLISGDHDHYISTETIVLPNETVTYEEAPCEPKPKRCKFLWNFIFCNFIAIAKLIKYISTAKMTPKKQTQHQHQQLTYQIITQEEAKAKLGKSIAITSSNIIEESFANATSNDIFTNFEEELVSNDIKQSTITNHGNIEVISSHPNTITSNTKRKDEFDIFGNFVAEIMRNMTKPKSRILQMNIMKLIADAESDS